MSCKLSGWRGPGDPLRLLDAPSKGATVNITVAAIVGRTFIDGSVRERRVARLLGRRAGRAAVKRVRSNVRRNPAIVRPTREAIATPTICAGEKVSPSSPRSVRRRQAGRVDAGSAAVMSTSVTEKLARQSTVTSWNVCLVGLCGRTNLFTTRTASEPITGRRILNSGCGTNRRVNESPTSFRGHERSSTVTGSGNTGWVAK